METYKGILNKGFCIAEKYSILLFIKQGSNAESYRAKGVDGKLYFVKLFNYAKLHRSAFDAENNLLEIELLKRARHENIVSYKDSGELIYENKKYGFLVLNFIAGETLAERMNRETFSVYFDVKQIVNDILKGLDYLHNLNDPIIHNEITPQNIMLDLSGDIQKAVIIDFGYARSFLQSNKSFNIEGLNLNYVASECFNGIYSPQSDIFSAGTVMYQMIFGLPPWLTDISRFKADRTSTEDNIIQVRKNRLFIHEVNSEFVDYNDNIQLIIKKALSIDIENRFRNATEFVQALNEEIEIEDIEKVQKVKSEDKPEKSIKVQKAKGKGFDAIAGMKELKEQLQIDVIDALQIPNGMLFYGPPGCGKTFIAKHFAEEVGFNFIHVNPGTLKSRYINATEENISKIFQEAEKNAPTIIFIEEISGLFPSRDSDAHEMSKNAVDAMLAEMDRTGERGIFVLCATNYPDRIDSALLRAGRLDKKVYLPPPDFEARKAMFELYLKSRPLDFCIDYNKLATLTDNYVSSDIKDLIVDEASRQALKVKSRITMKILEDVIINTIPSVPLQELKKYELMRMKMEGVSIEKKNDRPRVGF